MARRAGRGHHPRSADHRELDGHDADTSGTAVDEHRVALVHVGRGQRVPRGRSGEHQPSGLRPVQRRGKELRQRLALAAGSQVGRGKVPGRAGNHNHLVEHDPRRVAAEAFLRQFRNRTGGAARMAEAGQQLVDGGMPAEPLETHVDWEDELAQTRAEEPGPAFWSQPELEVGDPNHAAAEPGRRAGREQHDIPGEDRVEVHVGPAPVDELRMEGLPVRVGQRLPDPELDAGRQ